MSNILRILVCKFKGHAWTEVYGYRDKPYNGAVCVRCAAVYEWKQYID